MTIDKRARKILHDTFWSSSGWKREPKVAPEDFAYAKSKGLMFDPVVLSHNTMVDAAVKAVALSDSKAVSRAFVASLGTRRLELRSALGSYAAGRHMQPHSVAPSTSYKRCAYCGGYDDAHDPNILNFERMKWGGVRHLDPQYIAFDLLDFDWQNDITPTDGDYRILHSIFEAATRIGPTGRLSDLNRALSGLLASNSNERRTLIGILGYAGILIDPERPDFRCEFVPDAKREETPWYKDDWPYPVRWWNGSFGVNETAIREWFSDLGNGG